MDQYDPFPPVMLDRSSAKRTDPAALAELWGRRDARRIAIRDGLISMGAAPEDWLSVEADHRALLGIEADGKPWWLVRVDASTPAGATQWRGLREIGPELTAIELEALMTAVALESWHTRHGFCPTCGERTTVASGGWVRRCSADGTEHYPRTDPAIIVLVIDDDDRALLGRQATWPAQWRSALAGFVEPGERAESAVRREVAEEVGLSLGGVRYVASQPWPFPGSLMLGFHARASTTNIAVDGLEIAEAEWFSREQLADAAATGTIQLPPAISIARGLIERWFGKPIPGSWLRG